MPDDFPYMWNLRNKISGQAEEKQTQRHREHGEGCQRGEAGLAEQSGALSAAWGGPVALPQPRAMPGGRCLCRAITP